MKLVTTLSVGTLLLVGSLATSTAFTAAPGVISNQVITEGSYCHLTFPAIREETLSWDRPVLKDPSLGDIIDFYGPCDTDPLGEGQIHQQRLERRRRWQRSYNN
jgi:hypothetical protein